MVEHLTAFRWPEQLDTLLFAGLLFLLSQAAGRLANWLRAPRIIGYLVVGILFGPTFIGLFSGGVIDNQLGLITDIALSVIAFSIGGALPLDRLKGLKKSIAWITILQALGAFVFVFILIISILPLLIPLSGVEFQETYLAVALVLGAVSMATAPTAIMSLVHELKSKGRFTTVLLGVVAIDDALTIVIYGFVSIWVRALIGGEISSWSNALVNPLISVGFSVLIGLSVGLVLTRIIKFFAPRDVMLGLILGTILVTCGLAKSFGVSPLLATMVLGFIIENFAEHKRASEAHDVIENIEEPIFGIFFLLAGAHLDLGLATQTTGIALVVMGGRFLGKYTGSRLGARLSGAVPVVRKYLGLALLPSAGVAIGLVFDAKILIETASPRLSEVIVSVIVGKTLLNEIITPFLVRFSLIKAGEVDIEKAHFRLPLTLHGRKGSIIGHKKDGSSNSPHE